MAGGTTVRTTINIGGELDPSVSAAFSQINDYANKMSPMFSKIAKIAGVAATAIGGAFVAGAASFTDYDDALRQLQASTGSFGDTATDLADVMQQVYGNNFGESWGDVADSISVVNTVIGGTKEEIQNATENALAFRDTFGYEVNESARSASTLMKQFGLNSEEAYNLMAQGSQQGLDYSGELLDSINEYSVQFAKFGFSAEDMFNIFSNGAQNGAFNLDKIGDAVKEFSIRAIDGSNTTIDGFTQLGMNADEMASKFGAGGETASDAFFEVVDAIKAVDDPVKQSIIGVDLFGTMWEDLGPQVVSQLGDIGDEFNSNLDTMNQIKEIKYTSFMSGLTGIKRQMESALIPLGESLVPIMNDFANWFANVGAPKISEFADILSSNLPAAIEVIKGIFQGISPIFDLFIGSLPIIISLVTGFGAAFATLKIASTIGTIVSVGSKVIGVVSKLSFAFQAVAGGAATLGEGMAFIMGPIGWIALAIGAVIAIGTLLYTKCEGFRNFINSAIASIVSWFQSSLLPAIQSVVSSVLNFWNSVLWPFIQWLSSTLAPIFIAVFSAVKNVVSTAFQLIGNIITNGLMIFQGVIDFITGVFTGNWSLAWQGCIEIFSGIFNTIVDIAKAPINYIIDMINGAISGLNSIGSISLPDFLGGGSIGINIPEIPQFAEGGFTSGISIAGEAGPEAVIPLKRNNPRSLGLLQKTSEIIGGGRSSNSSGAPTFVFSPQISGEVTPNTIKLLTQSFEEFKEMVNRVLDEREREAYG